MTFDTEKLIREIESRKAIWDKSSEEYNDRDLKRRRWEEVTNIMCEENNLTENEKNEYGKSLQQKWKNIRTSFSRELKRRSGTKSGSAASRKSPYVYFEELQFLREIVVNNATQASIDITDSDESNNESHKVQICLPITKKAKKTNDDVLIEVLKQSISISEDREKKQELIQSDSDRLFLLSLLGDFKKIPEYQKLSTKIEIMHIIKRAQMLTLEIPNQGYSYYMSETSASDPYRPEALNSGQYFHGYSALTNYRPGASSIEQNRVYSTPVSNKQNTKMIFNEELSPTDSSVTTVTEHSDILDLFNTMSSKSKQKKMADYVTKTEDNSKKRAHDEDDENSESKKSKSGQADISKINFNCEKKSSKDKSWNLKIVSWNIAGMRAWIKKDVTGYLKKEDPDIICLQEIKCTEKQMPDEAKLSGYKIYINSGDKAGYSGVALFSKKKPINVRMGKEITELDDNEGRVIEAEYEHFYLVSTYIPNAGAGLKTLPKRMKWDEDFRNYLKGLDAKKPVILTGDLNVAHQEIDIANPKTNTKNAGFTKEERDNMSLLLDQGFIDTFRKLYPEKSGAYTFWTYFHNARARNVGWRLDYYITSERFMENVCDSVIRSEVLGSDHCPIVFYINV